MAIVNACPGFAVFPSSEAVLQQGREQGFAGCISATVNLTSADAGRVWQAPTALDAKTAASVDLPDSRSYRVVHSDSGNQIPALPPARQPGMGAPPATSGADDGSAR